MIILKRSVNDQRKMFCMYWRTSSDMLTVEFHKSCRGGIVFNWVSERKVMRHRTSINAPDLLRLRVTKCKSARHADSSANSYDHHRVHHALQVIACSYRSCLAEYGICRQRGVCHLQTSSQSWELSPASEPLFKSSVIRSTRSFPFLN